MADSSLPAVPQVNDGYWFAFSKTLIDGALKSRDDAAATLQTFVGWLWTLYTAGAVVGINLGKLSFSLPLSLLIASPAVILIGVYWMTVWVRTPEVCVFDPRVPDQIEAAYNHNLKRKQCKLTWTLGFTALAGALTAAAIVGASVAPQTSQIPKLAAHASLEGDSVNVFVSGAAPDASRVSINIYEYDGKRRGLQLTSEDLVADKGSFQSPPIKIPRPQSKALLIEVAADLKEAGAVMTLSKQVTPELGS